MCRPWWREGVEQRTSPHVDIVDRGGEGEPNIGPPHAADRPTVEEIGSRESDLPMRRIEPTVEERGSRSSDLSHTAIVFYESFF